MKVMMENSEHFLLAFHLGIILLQGSYAEQNMAK